VYNAVFRLEIRVLALVPKHGTADLRLSVLEGEIPVPGSGAGEVGYFTRHPHQGKGLFQYGFGVAIELTDGENCLIHGF